MAQYPPGALHWGGESVGENAAGGARWEAVLPLTLSRLYIRMSLGRRVPVARCLAAPGGCEVGTGKGRADVPAGFNRSEMNLDVLKTHLAFQQRVRGCARNRQRERAAQGTPSHAPSWPRSAAGDAAGSSLSPTACATVPPQPRPSRCSILQPRTSQNAALALQGWRWDPRPRAGTPRAGTHPSAGWPAFAVPPAGPAPARRGNR